MKTNEELQKDVQDAIKWEPLLNASRKIWMKISRAKNNIHLLMEMLCGRCHRSANKERKGVTISANKIECVKPRCDNKLSAGLIQKAATKSISGTL